MQAVIVVFFAGLLVAVTAQTTAYTPAPGPSSAMPTTVTTQMASVASTTYAPTTMAPAVTTMAPAVTTMAPAVTTMAPAVTTMAPAVTTMAPAVTTAAPAVTSTMKAYGYGK